MAAALRAVYGDRSLLRYDADDARLVASLDAIAEALREQAALARSPGLDPTVNCAQAVRLTLERVGQRIVPEIRGDPAIELTGFLEVPLDDAAVTIITSMNEGAVPASRNADPFLPNGLRSALGWRWGWRR